MGVKNEHEVQLQGEDEDQSDELVTLHGEADRTSAIVHATEIRAFPAIRTCNLQVVEETIAVLSHEGLLIMIPEHKHRADQHKKTST